ncbi:MAG: HAD family hydrolase [Bacteroidales bacterium]|nr:HAD family hydrolase [Bacteroidales bacterium]
MKIKSVIFDLDGTLYDNSALPLLVILNSPGRLRLLAAERRCRKRLAGRCLGDNPEESFLEAVSLESGIERSEVERWFFREYLPLQARLLKRRFKPRKWVVPLLSRLKAEGVRLACFSDYCYIAEKLEALGIDPEIFDLLADAVSFGGPKPCAKAAAKVLEILETTPQEALFVGDRTDTDKRSAEALGAGFLPADAVPDKLNGFGL